METAMRMKLMRIKHLRDRRQLLHGLIQALALTLVFLGGDVRMVCQLCFIRAIRAIRAVEAYWSEQGRRTNCVVMRAREQAFMNHSLHRIILVAQI